VATKRHDRAQQVIDSSGNIFADLGLPCSESDMLKVHIAHAITVTLQKRGLTQVQAAEKIGTDQAKISAIIRGRLKNFTVERLLTFLLHLGRDVNVRISKRYKEDRPGELTVNAA
jgi:predicted XRE-type DNA-binding protein